MHQESEIVSPCIILSNHQIFNQENQEQSQIFNQEEQFERNQEENLCEQLSSSKILDKDEEENKQEAQISKIKSEKGKEQANLQKILAPHHKKNAVAILTKGVEKISNHLILKKIRDQNEEGILHSHLSSLQIIKMFSDKKKQQVISSHMQTLLNILDKNSFLDLQDPQTCQMTIFLLQKPIKSPQEIGFLRKIIKLISVFKSKEELFESSSLSNKIVQNLRSKFIKKYHHLFRYGERGHEYFILLQGKAYCLIPYSNIFPADQIKAQTKTQRYNFIGIYTISCCLKRLASQVIEEPSDEDFLFENYSHYQCVKIYKQGEAFGEIALLTEESKRMASIVCKEDSWFMTLDREGFNQILGSYQQHLLNEKVHFLKTFDIFKSVPVNKMLSFIMEMQEQVFEKGQKVYQECQQADQVYFLKQGDIELVKKHNEVGESKLRNQKYEKHFHNTRCRVADKVIVQVQCRSYFGDEDLNGIRNFTAVCQSLKCKLLSSNLEQLIQFLKVYQKDQIFIDNANLKKENYLILLKENLLHDFKLMDDNEEEKDEANIQLQSPKHGQDFQQELKIDNSSRLNLPVVSKFNNAFTKDSNQFIKQKHYQCLKNIYQSSCLFQLDDVPMTTQMNQDQDQIRRQKKRMEKNNGIYLFNHSQSFQKKIQSIYDFASSPIEPFSQLAPGFFENPLKSKCFSSNSNNKTPRVSENSSKDFILHSPQHNRSTFSMNLKSICNSLPSSPQQKDDKQFSYRSVFPPLNLSELKLDTSVSTPISKIFQCQSPILNPRKKGNSVHNPHENQINLSQKLCASVIPQFSFSQKRKASLSILEKIKSPKKVNLVNSIFGSQYQENLLLEKIKSFSEQFQLQQ